MKTIGAAAVWVLVLGIAGCSRGAEPGKADGAPPHMKKYVSESAAFVVYAPDGWTVTEQAQQGFLTMTATDPKGLCRASMSAGRNPAGGDLMDLARLFVQAATAQYPDIETHNLMVSPQRDRLVFDGTYTDPKKGRKEFRLWVSGRGNEFSSSSIEAPAGRLEENRPLLLTILSNVRLITGAVEAAAQAGGPSLSTHRLRDGSASFLLPQGWNCQDFGAACFLASDPEDTRYFVVAKIEVVTPQMGFAAPGIIVSPYRSPHDAWQYITHVQGHTSDMQFEKITPRPDSSGPMAQVYTGGPVEAEEFTYTCKMKGRPYKGYTVGHTLGSHIGMSWTFWHYTVLAPAEEFDRLTPMFASMLKSYTIDQQYAQNYVIQGARRLQQLQRETSAKIARNSEEIREMMSAAYNERQRSQDYIDYQRTSYIRGEQDWISSVEGGSVYRSDSWGTRNLDTGRSWEGKPYDYVNFGGENPRYNEQMQAVDSRALWEQHIRR